MAEETETIVLYLTDEEITALVNTPIFNQSLSRKIGDAVVQQTYWPERHEAEYRGE